MPNAILFSLSTFSLKLNSIKSGFVIREINVLLIVQKVGVLV